MRFTLTLADLAHTQAVGRALGTALAAGDVLALIGDLGAGKTSLSQGICAGLSLVDEVASPTFALVHHYASGRLPVWHVDLYRLEHARELRELGLDDLIDDARGVVLIEWADKFPVVPPDHLRLELGHAVPHGRTLTAQASGPRSQTLLEAWRASLST